MVLLFWHWLYIDAPRDNTRAFRDLIKALAHFFSFSLLLSTLFDPWRRDAIDLSRVPTYAIWQAMVNNGISRLVGFLLRLAVIGLGLLVITLVAVLGLVALLIWFFLPLLFIAAVAYGINLILGVGYGY